MQTTLRIDDQLYREAKAEAARVGTTLTRFIEEGIRLRLGTQQEAGLPSFRVYDPGIPCEDSDSEIRRVAREEEERRDLSKLGLSEK